MTICERDLRAVSSAWQAYVFRRSRVGLSLSRFASKLHLVKAGRWRSQ